jgi:hypothetical protein
MTTNTIFNIKRNDTDKAIEAVLKINGIATGHLQAAESVKFIMSLAGKKNPVPKVNAAAQIDDPATASVSYQWVAADTDTAGVYNAEWEVTYVGGGKATFPDDGYVTVNVIADLG